MKKELPNFFRHAAALVCGGFMLLGQGCGNGGYFSKDVTVPDSESGRQGEAVAVQSPVSFTLDLSDPAVKAKLEAQGAQVVDEGPDGAPCLVIALPPKEGVGLSELGKTVSFPVDIAPLRGAKVAITGLVKAEDVAKPAHRWSGVKVQLHAVSPTVGDRWIDSANVYGTFDWEPVGGMGNVPDDATKGDIKLGLQECSGTVRISHIQIRVLMPKPLRPAPVASLDQKAAEFRGVMSPSSFREQDFKDIKAWGANCMRWQIKGPISNLERYDQWFDEEMAELPKVLEAARANGIKLVLDLHLPPGGREPDGTLRMVLDKKQADIFVANWERIARLCKGHPAVWGYDLVNEPVQNKVSPEGVDDWLGIQVRAAKAVRKIDPDTPIFIEVDEWDKSTAYAMMQPVDVPNIIYQVHMYWPPSFTHQGIRTDQGVAKDKDSKVSDIRYPGVIDGKQVDKEALRAYLQPVRDFQKAYNARIYVGEFSAVRWAPGAAQYIDDLISIYEEYGWDWTYHAFREWPGWSVEHADLPYDRNNHPKADKPTDRQKVLLKWFEKNQPAGGGNS